MFFPPEEQFVRRAQDKSGQLLVVHTELHNDMLTPIALFRNMQAQAPYAFLLESVEHGTYTGRYTFMGEDPLALIRFQKNTLTITERGKEVLLVKDRNPFPHIRAYMKQFQPLPHDPTPPFIGGAVGYVGYDVVRATEDIPEHAADTLNIPDIFLMVADKVIVFDHLTQRIHVVGAVRLTDDRSEKALRALYVHTVAQLQLWMGERFGSPLPYDKPLPLVKVEPKRSKDLERWSNMSQDTFIKAVKRCLDYICAGDILQVVLSQRFSVPTTVSPIAVYRCLRALNPSPYMFYLKYDDLVLTGSSPETMVKVADTHVFTKPIAGTRQRGSSVAEDKRLAHELLNDPKERAEHVMLVDLGRNDIGKIAEKNSVKVKRLMDVEYYSHVMHIVSEVVGELRSDCDAYDAILATFPAGTLSGAPKIRAMEIIDELEPQRRATYGGLTGYIGFDGQMDTCITIRSMVFVKGVAHVQAGAGIVADSVPEKEYEETVNKAAAVLRAIEMAEHYDSLS